MKNNSVIYQIVVDRFNNNSGDLFSKMQNPEYNNIFGDYMGGKFKGITREIPYLKSLGITHIMISPVQKSRFYHGYLSEDHLAINPHFGNEEELKEMVNEFHQKGIKVILDVVLTHLSSTNPLFLEKKESQREEDKDWFLWLDRIKDHPNYKSPYFSELIFKLTDGHRKRIEDVNKAPYLCYFGLPDHPLLNLENREVREWTKDCLNFWADNFGFDGIRLDSSFIQPRDYIREIHNHLKKKGLELLVEYWSFDFATGKCLDISDGEFDISGSMLLNNINFHPELFRDMMNHYYLHQKDNLHSQLILSIDSHDLPRFNGDKNLQKIATTLQFTLPSVPLIYYGNEISMKTYNDRRDRIAQSRDPMRFDMLESEQEMIQFYKRLITFRTKNFSENHEICDVQINDEGSLLTYRLKLDNQEYYVLLNRENREKPVNLKHLFNGKIKNFDVLSENFMELTNEEYVTLKPISAYILANSNISQNL